MILKKEHLRLVQPFQNSIEPKNNKNNELCFENKQTMKTKMKIEIIKFKEEPQFGIVIEFE